MKKLYITALLATVLASSAQAQIAAPIPKINLIELGDMKFGILAEGIKQLRLRFVDRNGGIL